MTAETADKIRSIEGLILEDIHTIGAKVKISEHITSEGLQQLLYLLRVNNLPFAMYDPLYPSGSDPGAYITYSRQKSNSEDHWSMTLGNHGWSGGIYHIQEWVICAQLENLARLKVLEDIDVERASFFSHYEMKTEKENMKINQELLRMHTQQE